MSNGYFAQTVQIGTVGDKIVNQPSGSGQQLIGPTIPAAVAQTSRNSTTAPYYTKSSSTVLVLTMASPPSWTSGSLMGIFWTTGGVNYFLLDCTVAISTNTVTITAPTTIPTGQTNFATITAGTTVVTFAVATLATGDLPANPDVTSYTLPIADILQLVLTANQTGGFELFAQPVGLLTGTGATWTTSGNTLTVTTPGWVAGALTGLSFTIGGNPYTCTGNTATVATMSASGSTASGSVAWSIASPNLVLSWNYAYNGNFYNWVDGLSAAPFAGNIVKLRFYNSTMQSQVMNVAAQML